MFLIQGTQQTIQGCIIYQFRLIFPTNFQGIHRYILNLLKIYMHSTIRYWHHAKCSLKRYNKWLKGVTQGPVSCHFVILTKIYFIRINHVKVKKQVCHNFSKYDSYKCSRLSIRYRMITYGTLSYIVLPWCFHAQIAIRRPFQILRDASQIIQLGKYIARDVYVDLL